MFRDPNVGTTALDSLLDRFTPLHHLDKLRESLITISTVAIIGRRTAATSSKGTEYIKWQLTGKKYEQRMHNHQLSPTWHAKDDGCLQISNNATCNALCLEKLRVN